MDTEATTLVIDLHQFLLATIIASLQKFGVSGGGVLWQALESVHLYVCPSNNFSSKKKKTCDTIIYPRIVNKAIIFYNGCFKYETDRRV